MMIELSVVECPTLLSCLERACNKRNATTEPGESDHCLDT